MTTTGVVGAATIAESQAVSSITVSLPSGTQIGELLVVGISYEGGNTQAAAAGYNGGYSVGYGAGGGGTGAPAVPSGWSTAAFAQSTDSTVLVYTRTANATSGSVTFPVSAYLVDVSACMFRVAGVAAPNPIDGTISSASSSVSGVSVPAVTTTAADGLLLGFYGAAVANPDTHPVPPATQTLVGASTGVGATLAVASEARPAAGPTGARVWTTSWTGTGTAIDYPAVAVELALRAVTVTATRTTSWRTGRTVTNTHAGTWKIGGPLGAQVSTTWSTNQLVPMTAQPTSWLSRRTVTALRSSKWSTLSSITNTTTFMPAVQLRVYAPIGEDLGVIPTPQNVTIGYPLNDLGALTFDYLTRAARSELLGQPVEIAVEFSPDGFTWTEPYDSRFIYNSDGYDPLKPDAAYSVECKPYVWRLSKVKLKPLTLTTTVRTVVTNVGPGQPSTTTTQTVTAIDGKRTFADQTVGQILKTLFVEAQARNALVGIDHSSFTAAVDSAGMTWSARVTVDYDPGVDYLQVLQNFADQGLIDYRTKGRALFVYIADTAMAADRTISSPTSVVLRSGRDLTEAPFRRTWEGLADTALFVGNEGAYAEVTNPLAETPWGRQEVFISNGSISDPGTMALLIATELGQDEEERVEHTHGLDFTRAVFIPFRDYFVGDYVLSAVTTDIPVRLRLRQITLTVGTSGALSGNAVLNDRFVEADIRAKRRVDGITNGATSSSSGTIPDPPLVDTTDKTTPVAPAGFGGSSAVYTSTRGINEAQATLSWSAVTANTDGTVADDIDHYELYQRPQASPVAQRQMTASTTETTYSLSPFAPASAWVFSVRAVDTAGHRSKLTDLTLVMAADNTPPQKPTSPAVTSKLGVLTVTWDGQPSVGTWPLDFVRVIVYADIVNDFTPDPSNLVDYLYGAGSTVIADAEFGVPLFVKLVAVDTTGLRSEPSDQVTATPSRLVGTDLDPGSITYEQIAFKDPGNVIPDGSFETDSYRNLVAARSSSSWSFVTGDGYLAIGSATIDSTVSPSTNRNLLLMSVEETQQIQPTSKLFCRFAYKGSAGADGNLWVAVEWRAGDTALSRSVVEGIVKNGTWQQAAAQVTAPTGATGFRVYVQLSSASTVGTYSVDAVEVRRTVGTSIIEDAAIGNAQIQALAVNSAQIQSLDVGKITAGTLSATVLLGGMIRTSSAGARLELSGTGQRLYDYLNNLKGWWDPSSGKLRIYATGDASHTSTNHGLQFGVDNGQNLIMDENEIMSRFNGSYGDLNLNREGGRVIIGGKKGGFAADGSDYGKIPADSDHQVGIRASVLISNVSDGDAGDNYSPFIIGALSANHLWADSNELGAANGNSPSTLFLNAASNATDGTSIQHTQPVVLGSGSIGIRRGGIYNAGDRMGFIYGFDAACDVGLKFAGDGNALVAKGSDNTGFRDMVASAFTVSSERAVKHSIEEFDPKAVLRAAPSRRWQYRSDIEPEDRWHYGPMLDDLPDDLHRNLGPIGEAGTETVRGYNIADIVGILWAAVTDLINDKENS